MLWTDKMKRALQSNNLKVVRINVFVNCKNIMMPLIKGQHCLWYYWYYCSEV